MEYILIVQPIIILMVEELLGTVRVFTIGAAQTIIILKTLQLMNQQRLLIQIVVQMLDFILKITIILQTIM